MHNAFTGLHYSANRPDRGLPLPPMPHQGPAGTTPCPLSRHRHNASAKQEAGRAKRRFRRHHWRQAKRLSPFITETDIRAWFITEPALPCCSVKRIIHLVKIRESYLKSNFYHQTIRVDAAIWREVRRLKHKKPTNSEK